MKQRTTTAHKGKKPGAMKIYLSGSISIGYAALVCYYVGDAVALYVFLEHCMCARDRFEGIDMGGERGQFQAVVAIIGTNIVENLLCCPCQEFLNPVACASFIVVPVAEKCQSHILWNFHNVWANLYI